jgi:hypothetical protein
MHNAFNQVRFCSDDTGAPCLRGELVAVSSGEATNMRLRDADWSRKRHRTSIDRVDRGWLSLIDIASQGPGRVLGALL